MVRPSDGVGEDGRSWVELELDPGSTVEEHLLVRNLSRETVTFQLTAADGYFTATGRFNMLTSDQESVDAGTWIEIQDSIEVPSGGDAIVPFTITVPENATPGDHPAGVAASIRSGGEVGVESRVGFRVMTRVTGEMAPALTTSVSGTYTGSINPFEPGTLTLTYEVSNTGNVRLGVESLATVSGPFGWLARTLDPETITEIAPGESRTFERQVRGVWPLFVATVDVVSQGASVAEDLEVGEIAPSEAQATVITMPWSQLVVIAIIVLLIVLSALDRRRRKRKTEALIAQARADAVAEAVAAAQRANTSGT
ncbi:hypothetical protein ACFC3F_09625 [Microbacterium sp. NPDC055910]|uniref:COG1470 family protein n=1 Tax=Microbacterium sp. NPDC055910 TaxID=3345659 RepID=UPI0035E04833